MPSNVTADDRLPAIKQEAQRVLEKVSRANRRFAAGVTVASTSWIALRATAIISSVVTAIVASVQAGTGNQKLAWGTALAAFLSTAASIVMAQTRVYEWWQLKTAGLILADDLDTRIGTQFALCRTVEDYSRVIEVASDELLKLNTRDGRELFDLYKEVTKGNVGNQPSEIHVDEHKRYEALMQDNEALRRRLEQQERE
jgi:hypothetical protein